MNDLRSKKHIISNLPGFITKPLMFEIPEDFKVNSLNKGKEFDRAIFWLTTIASLMIITGFVMGSYGYQFSPYIANQFSSINGTGKTPAKSAASKLSSNKALTKWPTYSNIKYQFSFDYPDTWQGTGLNNPQADIISLNSQTQGKENINPIKIEIAFYNAKGKELKKWIDSNNVANQTTKGNLVKMTVGSVDAYQQNIFSPVKSIKTYLERANKIMVISYSCADDERFEIGQEVYDQIIQSFNFS